MKSFCSSYTSRPTVVYFSVVVDGLHAPLIEFEVGLSQLFLDDPTIAYVTCAFRFDTFGDSLQNILDGNEVERFVSAVYGAKAIAETVKAKLKGGTLSMISSPVKVEALVN